MPGTAEVIVVGAGAVGMLVAIELALKNVNVLVLERESGPPPPWKRDELGFRQLYLPAMAHLYRRGMLNNAFPEERPQTLPEKKPGFAFTGHFGGYMINGNAVDFQQWADIHLPGPTARPGSTTLGHIEKVVHARAAELKIPVLRGKTVTTLENNDDGVKVWCGDELFECQWLVGCDGGRSTVRKQAGIEYIGTEAQFTGYAANCKLNDPRLLKPGFSRGPNGGLYCMAGPKHIYAVQYGTEFDREKDTITPEHFQKVLRDVSGTDIVVEEIILASAFTDRTRHATQYRKGRVVLAGDAAHIWPPFSAQGLNTGFLDAMNLGWKLAATVKGYATPGLIDTYHNEQHPIAAGILDYVRAQICTMIPDRFGRGIGNIVKDFLYTEAGQTYCVGRQWGFNHKYPLGDEHKLVGRMLPDYTLDDGSRLGPKLGSLNFVLVTFGGCSQEVADSLKALAPGVLHYNVSEPEKTGLKAVMARPDAWVTWATTEEVDLDTVKDVMERYVVFPAAIESASQAAKATADVQQVGHVASNVLLFGGEKAPGVPIVPEIKA